MACDVQSLITGASCLECQIPPGMELSVLIVLAAQIAGVPVDAQSLVTGAVCNECRIPQGLELSILIAIACQL